MYYSSDKRFIVKQITHEEMDTLLSMLDDYEDHMKKSCNERGQVQSLLLRVLQCNRIKMYHSTNKCTSRLLSGSLYFIVTENLMYDREMAETDAANQPELRPSRSQEDLKREAEKAEEDRALEVFDLKGSWVSRSTLQDGSSRHNDGGASANPHGKQHSRHTMKDNDLREKMYLNEQQRERFIWNLEADSAFLCAKNIMDYSLLLGIEKGLHDVQQQGEDQDPLVMAASNAFTARSYYVGIIDILQKWDRSKQTERYVKALTGQDLDGVSSCDPEKYRDRFVRKMKEHVYNESANSNSKISGRRSNAATSTSGVASAASFPGGDDNSSDRYQLGLDGGGGAVRLGSKTKRPLLSSDRARPSMGNSSISSAGSRYPTIGGAE